MWLHDLREMAVSLAPQLDTASTAYPLWRLPHWNPTRWGCGYGYGVAVAVGGSSTPPGIPPVDTAGCYHRFHAWMLYLQLDGEFYHQRDNSVNAADLLRHTILLHHPVQLTLLPMGSGVNGGHVGGDEDRQGGVDRVDYARLPAVLVTVWRWLAASLPAALWERVVLRELSRHSLRPYPTTTMTTTTTEGAAAVDDGGEASLAAALWSRASFFALVHSQTLPTKQSQQQRLQLQNQHGYLRMFALDQCTQWAGQLLRDREEDQVDPLWRPTFGELYHYLLAALTFHESVPTTATSTASSSTAWMVRAQWEMLWTGVRLVERFAATVDDGDGHSPLHEVHDYLRSEYGDAYGGRHELDRFLGQFPDDHHHHDNNDDLRPRRPAPPVPVPSHLRVPSHAEAAPPPPTPTLPPPPAPITQQDVRVAKRALGRALCQSRLLDWMRAYPRGPWDISERATEVD